MPAWAWVVAGVAAIVLGCFLDTRSSRWFYSRRAFARDREPFPAVTDQAPTVTLARRERDWRCWCGRGRAAVADCPTCHGRDALGPEPPRRALTPRRWRA